ncbi:MFS transporter [Microbacterium sp. Marseille-Q6965]|uniref:MFS transporter n=1 Tax=Microbacterium sp. Marseille-Q6965 TaxID=2965072 RepID=UPI0021B79125|nr:MFS transporter [Microbacterium sp. Marseille-Q6965]
MTTTRPPLLTPRDRILMWVLCTAVFLDSMGVSLMSIAVPAMQTALGMSPDMAQWVLSGYTVAFGGLLLLGGRLVDAIGHKRTLILGIALLAGGGLASGLASTGSLVIAGRLVSGIGAALVAPASLATLLAHFHTDDRRGAAIRAYAAAGAVGYGAGLIISGALTSLDWRITVLLPAAFAVILLVLSLVVVPNGDVSGRRSLNLAGSLSITLTLLATVFVIATVPVQGWGTVTVGAVVLAVAAMLVFLFAERRHPEPLLSRGLARSGTLVPGNVLAFLWAAASIGWQFVAALYLHDELHLTPLLSGLAILPLAVMIVLTQVVGKNWTASTDPRVVGVVGMVLQAAGIAWFLVGIGNGDYWTGALPGVMLHGIGNGLAFPTFYSQATSGVAPAATGVASALVNTSVQIGSGIGVALASALVVATGGYGPAFVGAATFSLLGAGWSALKLRRP